MTKRLGLTDYARVHGITRQAALKRFNRGTLPNSYREGRRIWVLVGVPDGAKS